MKIFSQVRLFFLGFTLLFLFLGSLPILTSLNHHHVFPFYSWELGFGRVFPTAKFQKIKILEIDGQILKEPVMARDLLKDEWKHTTDYRLAQELVQYIQQKSPRANMAQAALENQIFRKTKIRTAKYQVIETIHNPIEFYRTGQIIDEITYGDFIYDSQE